MTHLQEKVMSDKKGPEAVISIQRYMSGEVELWKGSKRIMKFASEGEFQIWLAEEKEMLIFLAGGSI